MFSIYFIHACLCMLLLSGCKETEDKVQERYTKKGTDTESTINEEDPSANVRKYMVETQLKARGIVSSDVLEAMEQVPRHEFVPPMLISQSYDDRALPVGYHQTISQPYIVAHMSQMLNVKPGDKVLEVGTGSGYQTAVLAQMGLKVHSIEIVEPLGKKADALLKRLGYSVNITIKDGYEGLPDHAPYDGIIVTAAPEQIPQPLIEQLAEGGRIVIPVGDSDIQWLYAMRKKKGTLVKESSLPVRFVTMTGKSPEDGE